MDIKYATLYLYHDTLIQATIFYNEDKSGFWEKFYYNENAYFYATLSSRGMRFSIDGTDKKIVAFAEWLIANKSSK